MKDLNTVSEKEQADFFKSFDNILCDVDGVLWRCFEDIPGANSAITTLKKICKKITFVSNNTTISSETYRQHLEAAGYQLEKNDLIQPTEAIVEYLKSIRFDKNIFLIGMAPLRDALSNAGFKVVQHEAQLYEDIVTYLKSCLTLNEEVGAVICDYDVNVDIATLQMAQLYIKNLNALFISGGSDFKYCVSGGEVMGPGVFHDVIQDITERSPLNLAKPSAEYGEYIKKKLQIKTSQKVLVIGDTIVEDMGLAQNCGFQKLLVLSGVIKKEDVENWTFTEDLQPEYYVDSLKIVDEIVQCLIKKQLLHEYNIPRYF